MVRKARIASGVTVFALAVLMLLLPRNAQSDGPRDHGLLSAIRRGDLALLESHLREGAPVNVQTSEGTTPLMLAVLFGTSDTVRLLLEHGADPNAVDKSGASPLLFAAGELQKAQLLIGAGAKVNARSALGNTPLIAAAAHPDNLAVIKLLLDKGADANAANQNNVTALAAAVWAADAGTVCHLLNLGCKPGRINNLFGAAENSLLEIAAGAGAEEIVELLLTHGADVNAGDANFAGHALNYALFAEARRRPAAHRGRCGSEGMQPRRKGAAPRLGRLFGNRRHDRHQIDDRARCRSLGHEPNRGDGADLGTAPGVSGRRRTVD